METPMLADSSGACLQLQVLLRDGIRTGNAEIPHPELPTQPGSRQVAMHSCHLAGGPQVAQAAHLPRLPASASHLGMDSKCSELAVV